MTEIEPWLAERVVDAPEELRNRMIAAANSSAEGPVHERLARAAQACLRRAMRASSRESALELLTADALLTHACEAAAESGSETLTAFANTWTATRFEQLLTSRG
jgi:hypothetical protein